MGTFSDVEENLWTARVSRNLRELAAGTQAFTEKAVGWRNKVKKRGPKIQEC